MVGNSPIQILKQRDNIQIFSKAVGPFIQQINTGQGDISNAFSFAARSSFQLPCLILHMWQLIPLDLALITLFKCRR
jgi:hypothetical protein